jgi:hypothetical protein
MTVGFASSLGGPLFGVWAHSRSLGFPGSPVEVSGVGELHAAFFEESRTRDVGLDRAVGDPGFARDDKSEGGASINSRCLGWTERLNGRQSRQQ